MQTALITGSTGGLGIYVTEKFLREGWRVHASVNSAEGRDLLKERFDSWLEDSLTVCECDLSTEAGAREFAATAPATPDALINLVGGIRAGTLIDETSIESFDLMMSLNVRTTFLVIREVVSNMRRNGGSIVTIGARAVEQPEPRKAAYAASKAAVAALTHAVTAEYKEHNIRANCILPGIIRTNANREWGADDEIEKWTPPEDIAAAVFSLCTEAGKGINGATIPMYGKL